jgi:hypothetical protein
LIEDAEEAEEFLEAEKVDEFLEAVRWINSLNPQKHSWFKFYILLIRSNKIRFGSIRAVQL